MKLKILSEFYGKLLKDMGVYDAGEGKLSYLVAEGKMTPITVDGKRLCLPTRENLRNLDLNHNIIFHPLAEQIISGPSPILNALRDYMQLRLTFTATTIATKLMELAADPKRHAKLPASAKTIIKALSEADPKAITVLNRVLDKVGDTPETRMYNIYLRSRGTKDKPNGIRTTVVSWPILDDATTDTTDTFNGIRMDRKTKDKRLVVAILNYVLRSEVDSTDEQAEYTTTIGIAPYFHTMLEAFVSQATWLTTIVDRFVKHIPDLEEYKFQLDYLEEFADFENFALKIGSAAPLLPGNGGKIVAEESEDNLDVSSWSAIKDKLIDDDEDVIAPGEDNRRSSRTRERDNDSLPNWKRKPERDRGLRFGERRERNSGFDLGDDSRRDDRRSSRRDSRDSRDDRRGRDSRRGYGRR